MANTLQHRPRRRSRLSVDVLISGIQMVIDGLPSLRIQKELTLGSYHTALRLADRIRQAMADVEWPAFTGPLVLSNESMLLGQRAELEVWVCGEFGDSKFRLLRLQATSERHSKTGSHFQKYIRPSSRITTPQGGYWKWVSESGFKHRPVPLGSPELREASALLSQIRSQLSKRHEQASSPAAPKEKGTALLGRVRFP
jgi:hypothetical protein